VIDRLRIPLFIIAIILIAVVVLVEAATSAVSDWVGADTPGVGITTLAIMDGLALYTVLLMGLALIIQEGAQGKIQGIITLIVSLLTLIGTFIFIFVLLFKLILMVSLLLATPFGTIAYFALFGDFDTDSATVTLSLMMTLKLAFAVFLVFAHQRFLENKGLVLVILTCLLTNFLVSFLHALVPGFLVSITDALAGIIVLILALIWSIFFLIGAIVSIVKVIV
jgi:hypothetical protein